MSMYVNLNFIENGDYNIYKLELMHFSIEYCK